MSKYEILTFEKNLDRAYGWYEKLGYPEKHHDVNNVVFLQYSSEAEMRKYLPLAKDILRFAVPVTFYGSEGEKSDG